MMGRSQGIQRWVTDNQGRGFMRTSENIIANTAGCSCERPWLFPALTVCEIGIMTNCYATYLPATPFRACGRTPTSSNWRWCFNSPSDSSISAATASETVAGRKKPYSASKHCRFRWILAAFSYRPSRANPLGRMRLLHRAAVFLRRIWRLSQAGLAGMLWLGL